MPTEPERSPASTPDLPTTARGRRTRAALLTAARRAFAGVDWSRTRVSDVCREAGVGHGTFYAYFPNKTALLEALVAEHAAALQALMDQPWASGPDADPAVDVRRVLEGYVGVTLADRDVREAWTAAAAAEPRLAELDGVVRRAFVGRIAHTLAAAHAPALAADGLDVDATATALAAMVERTVELALLHRPGSPPQDRVDQVVDTLTALWVRVVAPAGRS